MCEQQADLLEHAPGRKLRKAGEEARERARALGVLRVEFLARDLAQDLVAELRVVELLREHGQALGHWLRQMLVVLQRLHDADLRAERVRVVLDGEADDLKHAELDRL